MHFRALSTLEGRITHLVTLPSKTLVPAVGLRPSKQPRIHCYDVSVNPNSLTTLVDHVPQSCSEEAIELSSTDPDSTLEAVNNDDPLAKYFDPQTSLLHEHILEPPSPPIATWERDLQHRIDNGRGLTASIDRFVDRTVRRIEAAIGHA
ncbi:uncharacterized protein NFIA_077920 [Aspergillus fischeri NRRL 181]|uniref:Uncharacterized protein n=1 Tax=Neosartorya fischeri (strain ATCC 1020 / DSM 3700 / CBS 544.65 / FGSC A1164 / JCM 1740 / NRRL 181 / WB 181) TaxID=331117 RepID=A1DEP5_NEOFI|nr:uncharacterized protein NFIA_077920 [Aspergillus fischeri NRRL 181]EAW17852.1 hypothetical protein NFIA_077920 [Aspergillus fischeri NRRL 181]